MRIFWLPKPVFKTIAVVLAMSIFAVPVSSIFAQGVGTACADARRQAHSDISGGTWFAIGCVGGLIGYLIAMSEPNPPSTQLLGKSPEYVAAYTDCYRKEGKSIKTKNALYGCLVDAGVQVIFWTIYFLVLYEATDTSSNYWY